MGALEPTQRPDAGVWARWDALRYLQTTFSARLDRERRTALRHWCLAVEENLGSLPASALPPESLAALTQLEPAAVTSPA